MCQSNSARDFGAKHRLLGCIFSFVWQRFYFVKKMTHTTPVNQFVKCDGKMLQIYSDEQCRRLNYAVEQNSLAAKAGCPKGQPSWKMWRDAGCQPRPPWFEGDVWDPDFFCSYHCLFCYANYYGKNGKCLSGEKCRKIS